MTPIVVLFTGSREWWDRVLVARALLEIEQVVGERHSHRLTLRHGGYRGLDAVAAEMALARRWRTESFPADWENGPQAGPERNRRMVLTDPRPVVCVGFPMGVSRGTRHCMAEAERAGIPTIDATLSGWVERLRGVPITIPA